MPQTIKTLIVFFDEVYSCLLSFYGVTVAGGMSAVLAVAATWVVTVVGGFNVCIKCGCEKR